MTQPKRWLDDAGTSAEIRELILAGQHPPRFPKVALGVVIVPLAQKAAWASTWSWPAGAVIAAKATTVGLVIGLGSVAAVTTLSGQHSTSSVTAASERLRATPPQARSVGSPSDTVASTPGSAVVATQAVEPVAPPRETPSVTVTAEARNLVAVSSPSGIAAEADLLERARSLLGESPTRALMLTVEHRDRFPSAQMAAERELLAIDALLRLGRTHEAQQRATPFLADGSNQVFAARVRHLLERGGR